jgi:hypothetical protein
VAVSSNTFSTGCWVSPTVPILNSPADQSIVGKNSSWSKNPVMTWSASTSSCPLSTGIYYIYQSSYDSLVLSPIYTSDKLTNSFIPATGTPDGVYYWHVKACDSLDHCSAWSNPWKLTVDNTLPTSAITYPFNSNGDNMIQYTYLWNGKATGTAADNLSGSGVNHVELSIERTLLNLFWDGSNWVSDPNVRVHVDVSGPNNYWSYQFNNQPPFGRFRIIAHAVDNAGNTENSATIEFDNDEVVTSPEPIETPTPSVVPEPDFSVDLNHSAHHLSFTTANFPDAVIHYEVLYQNSVGQQGIAGDIPVSELVNGVVSRDFYLGTCSSGGTCTPDNISIGSSLSVNLNGQIKTLTY